MKACVWLFFILNLMTLAALAKPKAQFSGQSFHRFSSYSQSGGQSGQDHWLFAEQKVNSDFWAFRGQVYAFAGNSKANLIQSTDAVETRDSISEMWPGDFYLQLSGGPALLKLGYQQIAWQEGLGISYTNFINARDYRVSLFDPVDQVYRSAPAANLVLSGENLSLQAVYLPYSQFDLRPPSSRWGGGMISAATGSTVEVQNPENKKLSNEAGARLTWAGEGFDFSAFYFRLKDRKLVYQIKPNSTIERLELIGEHDFIENSGATTSLNLHDFLLRLEYLEIPKRQWNRLANGALGIEQSKEVAYTIGLDSPVWEHFSFSLQHSISTISEEILDLERKKEESISFLSFTVVPKTDHALRLSALYLQSEKTSIGRLSYLWPLSRMGEWELGYEGFSGPDPSQGFANRDLSRFFLQLSHRFEGK